MALRRWRAGADASDICAQATGCSDVSVKLRGLAAIAPDARALGPELLGGAERPTSGIDDQAMGAATKFDISFNETPRHRRYNELTGRRLVSPHQGATMGTSIFPLTSWFGRPNVVAGALIIGLEFFVRTCTPQVGQARASSLAVSGDARTLAASAAFLDRGTGLRFCSRRRRWPRGWGSSLH